jgi:mono/diheme cytochrome c family protein
MKAILKWSGIVLGAIVVLVLLFAGFVYSKTGSMLNKQYDIAITKKFVVPTDSLSLAHGKHIATAWAGCVDCHGKDFGGMKLMDALPFARLYGANLTTGEGGLPKDYSIEQFDRAVRHGVKRNGKGIWIMPSYHYTYMSDEDLAALYAYIKSLKPVNRTVPEFALGPIGRMVLTTGGLPNAVPEYINHDKQPPPKPAAGVTREYGEYLTKIACIGCHAPNFSGGTIFGGDPKWPPAANITMGGKLQLYKSENDLKTLLREGERPDGSIVDPVMPITNTSELTDEEISTLWLYLSSFPRQLDSSATWWTTKAP